MPGSLDKFKNTLPYATELFGVYQPLIGWKARQALTRIDKQANDALDATVSGMALDPRVQTLAVASLKPVLPTVSTGIRLPLWLKSQIGTKFQGLVEEFI